MSENPNDIPIADVVELSEGSTILTGLKGVIYYQTHKNDKTVGFKAKLAPLPSDKQVIRSIGDRSGWRPTKQEILNSNFTARMDEKSPCCMKSLCCLCCRPNFRPFKMEMVPEQTVTISKAQENRENRYKFERPGSCGGICCCPHTLFVFRGDQEIGRVIEDWKCDHLWIIKCCLYLYYTQVPYKIQMLQNGEYRDRYNILVNTGCFGPHNNCCGSTICKNDMLFNVNNYTSDKSRGYIQKTFAPSSSTCNTLCRCCSNVKSRQYLIAWPELTTDDEKALYISAVTLIDYIMFLRNN